MDYYAGKEGHHFVAPNGFVRLSALNDAPSVVRVVFRKWPDTEVLRSKLERELGSPVYLSMVYGQPMAEFDIYALINVDYILRAQEPDKQILRTEVVRAR